MWRSFAKRASSSKKLKFSSNDTKLCQGSCLIENIRCPEAQPCLISSSSSYSFLGFRRIGILSSQNDGLRKLSFTILTNSFSVSALSKSYGTAAAQAVVSTDESDFSGSDELPDHIEEINNHHQKMEAQFRPQQKKTIAGMGIGKYNILKRRQIKMETEAWEEAAKEYQELLVDMCEQKLAPNLPYVKSLFLGWFEPLRDAIAAEQELCKQKSGKFSHGPYFEALPADMMAVITMHKMMGLLLTSNGGNGSVRVVQAACAVGEAIEHEVSKLSILVLSFIISFSSF